MKLNARNALRFALLFIPLFAACLFVYPWVMKVYHPAALGAANMIMERMDPPTRIEISRRDGWRAYDLTGGYKRLISLWVWWQKHLHFLSLALLPALLLATPAPWPERLRLLAIGIPLLFVVHSLTMVGMVRSHYCYLIDKSAFGCLWTLRVMNTSGQLFGAALWALLTWRYWLRKDPDPAEGEG